MRIKKKLIQIKKIAQCAKHTKKNILVDYDTYIYIIS